MAPIFRLEKFPHVCRLCLQSPDSQPVVMVPLRAIDPVLDGESIGDFITTITFVISEDKQHLFPNEVCLPCLEMLRFFAKYRSKITIVHLLMNSLIELKRDNSVPLVDLFRTKSDLIRTVIKDLDLCTVSDYSVQDLLNEFLRPEDSSKPPPPQEPAEDQVIGEVDQDQDPNFVDSSSPPPTEHAEDQVIDEASQDKDSNLVHSSSPPPAEPARILTIDGVIQDKEDPNPVESSSSPPVEPAKVQVIDEVIQDKDPDLVDSSSPLAEPARILTIDGVIQDKDPNPVESSSSPPAEPAKVQVIDEVIQDKDPDFVDSSSPPPAELVEVEVDVDGVFQDEDSNVSDDVSNSNTDTDSSSPDKLNDESTKDITDSSDSSDDDCPIMKKLKLSMGPKTKVSSKLGPPLKCDKCSFETYGRNNLRLHQWAHQQTHVEKKVRTYPCREPGCTAEFKTNDMLRRHKSKCHRTLKCDKCEFTTYRMLSLTSHKKSHVQPCKEPGCTKVFETYKTYYQHTLMAHRPHRPHKSFICEVCGLRETSNAQLKLHMDRHLNKLEHVCPYCQKGHNTKHDLRIHIKLIHKKDREYPCETCGLIFGRKPALDVHKLTHSDATNFACEVCDQKFKRRNNLQRHIKVMHDKVRVPCDHCSSTFTTTANLKDHIESAHGIQTRFLCDICVQMFDSQDKLDTHKARHDNPNELECPTCLVLFPSEERLGDHMCITYRADYECCRRDFRSHYFYNKHQLIKHGIRTNVRVKPTPGELLGQMRAKRKRNMVCLKCEGIFATRVEKKKHLKTCTGPAPEEGGTTQPETDTVSADAVSSTVNEVESEVIVE